MATIKSYSDLQQSEKLAEISADMYYYSYMSIGESFYMNYPNVIEDSQKIAKNDIPCWSLAALLSILPFPSLHKTFIGYRCDSYNKKGTTCKLGEPADNPIDACFKMILKLHELKML